MRIASSIVSTSIARASLVAFVIAAAVAAGCGGSFVTVPKPASAVAPAVGRHALIRPHVSQFPLIQHIVIIDLENRSFDNMFHGFAGADYATQGTLHDGTVVPMHQLRLVQPSDIGHTRKDFSSAYDQGKMDGFDLETRLVGFGSTPPPATYP